MAAVQAPLTEVPSDPTSALPPSLVPASAAAAPNARAVPLPSARYERLESNIGEGTYGKVHKARDLNTGRTVAIKKAKVSALDRDVGGIGFTALREIKLMQAVRHPNLMGCLDVFAEGGAIHLVMEFMDGDIKKLMDERGMIFNEPHVKCLARQLLEGLAALHAQFFVHRDIGPANVLVSFATGEIKLGDFGFSRTVGHGDRPLTPMCTTLWYRAPELLFGAKYYGQAVDLWSIGCVVAELFLAQALFPGRGELDMLGRICEKRGAPNEECWPGVSALPTFVEFDSSKSKMPLSTVLPGVSSSAQHLIDGLLTLDPKQRPTALQALAHEFFATSWPRACKPLDLPFVSNARTG